MSGRGALLVTAAAGAVFTLAVLALPAVPLAVRDPQLHVAVEMTATWVSLTAAVLVAGRLRRRRNLPDLVLVVAFGLTGLTNAALSIVPAIAGGPLADTVATWGALTGRLLAAAAFAFAALAPERQLAPRPWPLLAGAGSALLVGLVGAVVTVSAPALPPGVGGVVSAGETQVVVARVSAHPALATAQLTMALAYALAGWGFARRARTRPHPLLSWLAAAAVLAAFARVHYIALPSLYAGVVYSGDVLRVGFYSLLLGGVLAELAATWRALSAASAAEERRRIARDLHDGLAQELAFITTQATWLARRLPEERRAGLLASSAQRALDESRRAVEALAGTAFSSCPVALTRAVEEVASRHQQAVELEVDESLEIRADVCEHLVRIVREAVGNAARHGAPQVVSVRLAGGASLVLEVADDGAGFDPEAMRDEGLRFGLRTMRERAEALGGSCSVRSVRGGGTTVRVEVPWRS